MGNRNLLGYKSQEKHWANQNGKSPLTPLSEGGNLKPPSFRRVD